MIVLYLFLMGMLLFISLHLVYILNTLYLNKKLLKQGDIKQPLYSKQKIIITLNSIIYISILLICFTHSLSQVYKVISSLFVIFPPVLYFISFRSEKMFKFYLYAISIVIGWSIYRFITFKLSGKPPFPDFPLL